VVDLTMFFRQASESVNDKTDHFMARMSDLAVCFRMDGVPWNRKQKILMHVRVKLTNGLNCRRHTIHMGISVVIQI
jgi:hypothetical protein